MYKHNYIDGLGKVSANSEPLSNFKLKDLVEATDAKSKEKMNLKEYYSPNTYKVNKKLPKDEGWSTFDDGLLF